MQDVMTSAIHLQCSSLGLRHRHSWPPTPEQALLRALPHSLQQQGLPVDGSAINTPCPVHVTSPTTWCVEPCAPACPAAERLARNLSGLASLLLTVAFPQALQAN